MKKPNKTPKGKQQGTPVKPKAVTELSEQELEQVQGGQGLNTPDTIYIKMKY
jgi:bacteriocin-like protein